MCSRLFRNENRIEMSVFEKYFVVFSVLLVSRLKYESGTFLILSSMSGKSNLEIHRRYASSVKLTLNDDIYGKSMYKSRAESETERENLVGKRFILPF